MRLVVLRVALLALIVCVFSCDCGLIQLVNKNIHDQITEEIEEIEQDIVQNVTLIQRAEQTRPHVHDLLAMNQLDTTSNTTLFTWYKGPFRNKCSKLRVRRNLLSLSRSEVDLLIDAFKKLYANGVISEIIRVHTKNYFPTHNQPLIFWWHRHFIYLFENEMRKIHPDLTLPYWDPSEDADAPEKSIVLSDSYFGSNGKPPFYCVQDSFLKDMMVTFPEHRCVRRWFSGLEPGTITPWNKTERILTFIRDGTETDIFRIRLEDSLHYDLHKGVAARKGDMNSPSSPADPLFYLHHSNLDRLLYTWQLSKPERFDQVDGYQRLAEGGFVLMSKNYIMDEFKIPVEQVLRIEEEPYCYTYDYLPLDQLAKISEDVLPMVS